jgi:hypothetical protein
MGANKASRDGKDPGWFSGCACGVVNGPDGWVIYDVESPHDSLRMVLAQYRGHDH